MSEIPNHVISKSYSVSFWNLIGLLCVTLVPLISLGSLKSNFKLRLSKETCVSVKSLRIYSGFLQIDVVLQVLLLCALYFTLSFLPYSVKKLSCQVFNIVNCFSILYSTLTVIVILYSTNFPKKFRCSVFGLTGLPLLASTGVVGVCMSTVVNQKVFALGERDVCGGPSLDLTDGTTLFIILILTSWVLATTTLLSFTICHSCPKSYTQPSLTTFNNHLHFTLVSILFSLFALLLYLIGSLWPLIIANSSISPSFIIKELTISYRLLFNFFVLLNCFILTLKNNKFPLFFQKFTNKASRVILCRKCSRETQNYVESDNHSTPVLTSCDVGLVIRFKTSKRKNVYLIDNY